MPDELYRFAEFCLNGNEVFLTACGKGKVGKVILGCSDAFLERINGVAIGRLVEGDLVSRLCRELNSLVLLFALRNNYLASHVFSGFDGRNVCERFAEHVNIVETNKHISGSRLSVNKCRIAVLFSTDYIHEVICAANVDARSVDALMPDCKAHHGIHFERAVRDRRCRKEQNSVMERCCASDVPRLCLSINAALGSRGERKILRALEIDSFRRILVEVRFVNDKAVNAEVFKVRSRARLL